MPCGNMAISVPAIGELRQPVWPAEVYGSISHCGATALAVVSRQPIGVDIEEIFSAQTATELTDNIITPAEHERLADCGLAFSLALTLAFSAKRAHLRQVRSKLMQVFWTIR